MLRQSCKNLRRLRGSFFLSENHFRHAPAQAAMMVYLGEAQVFERHVPQAFDGIVGSDLTPAHLLEEFADGFRVHDSTVGIVVSDLALK